VNGGTGSVADASGKLEHRTAQAFARMNKRVKALEATGIVKQQLEDLLTLAPEVESLVKRVNRIENTLVHYRDMRENSIENDFIVAREMIAVRDRVLMLEGTVVTLKEKLNDSTLNTEQDHNVRPEGDG